MSSPPPGPRLASLRPLARAVESVARVLPAQGPIGTFIHHNTLHAFEHLSFEDAVVEAGELLDCEPFMAEDRYRAELARGRIRAEDVEAVLTAELGVTADEPVAELTTRGELRALMLSHGIPPAPHPEVEWLVHEGDALVRLRSDLPDASRTRILRDAEQTHGALRPRALERRAVEASWEACLEVARRVLPAPAPPAATRGRAAVTVRHRDVLRDATEVDTDAIVHPRLIALCAAYLDQGLAYWPAPERELPFYAWFLRLHDRPTAALRAPLEHGLSALVGEEARLRPDALSSLAHSLDALGIRVEEREPFLAATALALRGWAGMMRQLEERPDRAPVRAPKASLVDFLAVRLLLERVALETVARDHGLTTPLAALRRALDCGGQPAPSRSAAEVAWLLFHVAQLLGRTAREMGALPAPRARALVDAIDAFGSLERRRLLHLAYERRHRRALLDALAAHVPPAEDGDPPELQAIFCIDDREESLRRHLEEVAPWSRTFGAPGFFGVAMYFRGIGDAHPRPLCPISIRPDHAVREVALDPTDGVAALRHRSRRAIGRVSRNVSVGSRTFFRGTIITALLGALAAVPLVLRVLFPRLSAALRRRGAGLVGTPRRTRLEIDRRDDVTPAVTPFSGYTKEEMAGIVQSLLESIGLTRAFAPIVLVVGHGSSSLNNPHESAHDCGACGGGRGGPNARAFAQMANDPAVRSLLSARGLHLPPDTWFVGAEHNTCNDAVDCFDTDLVPPEAHAAFAKATSAMNVARRRDAQERCRRFAGVPTWFTPELALAHVEGRSEDLAQPRPEYGHATNAACVVGRRSRTRGLYLDRRAFLILVRSHDRRRAGDDARRGPRRRRPRHGRHQPRVLLRLRRSGGLRQRQQAAPQHHGFARRHGRPPERPAHRPALANGVDPRAGAARPRGRSAARRAHGGRGANADPGATREPPMARARDARSGHGADPRARRLDRLALPSRCDHPPGRRALRAVVPGQARPPARSDHSPPRRVAPIDRSPTVTGEWTTRSLVLVGLLCPIATIAVLGSASLVGRRLPEKLTGRLVPLAFGGSLAAFAAAWLAVMATPGRSVVVAPGTFFAVPHASFQVELLVDPLSSWFAGLTAAISGVVAAFSHRYLHREPGYNRFFVLLSVLVLGMLLVVLAGSIEVLVAGWELLGISSVLLVAFFQRRALSVENALRVWVVYRLGDAAMLSAAVLVHHYLGRGDLDLLVRRAGGAPVLSTAQATVVGALLLVAAAAKCAQIPFSNWLPRAMEGPTPSSAVFYGALSVHAGAYLLIRARPLIAESPAVLVGLGVLGMTTAIYASAAGRVQTDIKSSLAFASLTQVSIVLVEIALGLWWLAVIHMTGHTCFRLLQFLRSPSLLHDVHGVENATGEYLVHTGLHLERRLPAGAQRWAYRFLLERGHLDAALERVAVRPFRRLFSSLDAAERRLCDRVAGHETPKRGDPGALPHEEQHA